VPNVIGIAASDATQQLRAFGFNVTETSQANGTTQGTVVNQSICECGTGWSETGWSGWFWSRCPACDSRSNWPVSAVSFR